MARVDGSGSGEFYANVNDPSKFDPGWLKINKYEGEKRHFRLRMVDQCGDHSEPGSVVIYKSEAHAVERLPTPHLTVNATNQGLSSNSTLPLQLKWKTPLAARVQGFNIYIVGVNGTRALVTKVEDPIKRDYRVTESNLNDEAMQILLGSNSFDFQIEAYDATDKTSSLASVNFVQKSRDALFDDAADLFDVSDTETENPFGME